MEKLEFPMRTNSPIFIVGSPRSGTSILTWCLGQHSNIFVQEESNWIGSFALQIEIAYGVGTARGERSQLSALGVAREDFFRSFGCTINDLILDHRARNEANIRARIASRAPAVAAAASTESSAFQISRTESDPKGRWVDGTPEYSFYINPLRKLCPEARFIHVVRDVTAVVRSMMNFQRTGGPALVASEEQAYDYWLRTVRACFLAERAYGPEVVCRVQHADLLAQPRQTLDKLLAFLSEDFESSCLEPLQKRINSSEVPVDFDSSDSRTSQAVIDAAHRLSSELMENRPPLAPDPEAEEALENSFRERIRHLATLESNSRKARERIAELEKEIDSRKAPGSAAINPPESC